MGETIKSTEEPKDKETLISEAMPLIEDMRQLNDAYVDFFKKFNELDPDVSKLESLSPKIKKFEEELRAGNITDEIIILGEEIVSGLYTFHETGNRTIGQKADEGIAAPIELLEYKDIIARIRAVETLEKILTDLKKSI